MSTNTSIEWTDATWNPLRGTKGRHHCVRISPGCKLCYAATMNRRFGGPDYVHGADTPRLDVKALALPVRWQTPRMVFVCSMTDLFLESHTDEMIAEVWRVMAKVPRHTYQVLTKRADRLAALMPRLVATFGLCPHIWRGVSVETQPYADERIYHLLHTPAAVRWVSAEPLLGSVNFADIRPGRETRDDARLQPVRGWPTYNALRGEMITSIGLGYDCARLDWIVVGGESGGGARPCDLAWVRSIVHQSKAANVPVFVKQLGAVPQETFDRQPHDPKSLPDGWMPIRQNATDGAAKWFRNLKLLSRKGGDITEWPADVQVREWPRVGVAA